MENIFARIRTWKEIFAAIYPIADPSWRDQLRSWPLDQLIALRDQYRRMGFIK